MEGGRIKQRSTQPAWLCSAAQTPPLLRPTSHAFSPAPSPKGKSHWLSHSPKSSAPGVRKTPVRARELDLKGSPQATD